MPEPVVKSVPPKVFDANKAMNSIKDILKNKGMDTQQYDRAVKDIELVLFNEVNGDKK